MTVYRIIIGNSERFIRAASAAHARVRAYKVWHARPRDVSAFGQIAPNIGERGYNRACATAETHAVSAAQLRAQQSHAGPDNTGRAMYKPTEAARVKTQNRAAEILARYGIAAS